MNCDSKNKITIVGAGFVGSTIAYAIMNSAIATEICLYDIDIDKAMGEVMDLVHGTSFVSPVNIYAGSIYETKDSDIVIITAGAGQKEGETRLDLIDKNYKIFKNFVPDISKLSPNAILLVVSNPVDILTYITYKLSNFPFERVIGSGTVLDTSRYKYVVGKYFNVNNNNIHGYVMGEHGDSEFICFSKCRIGCDNFYDYSKKYNFEWDKEIENVIEKDVKNAAYEIIEKKKATYYAIALAVTKIVETIIRDENSILSVSCYLRGEYGINDIYLSVPAILNRNGVSKVLEINLTKEEIEKLDNSAKILKKHASKY